VASGRKLGEADPWQTLRAYTGARIALGRAGGSLPAAARLEFQMAHAGARDAVHLPMDSAALAAGARDRGWDVLAVASAAADRQTYLQRPDLGRRLDAESRQLLQASRAGQEPCDVVLVVADGLSALAVNRHALALLDRVEPELSARGFRLAPLVIAGQGRVALGDEIGALLHARLVAVFIGERPGLSAADSVGAYITCQPRVGRTDADRNCVSNIRPEGLHYDVAAEKVCWLVTESLRRGVSGVALKDEYQARPALDGTAGMLSRDDD